MKKIIFLFFALCTVVFMPVRADAQEYEPQDRMGFIFPVVGYKHLNFKSSNYSATTVGISLHNFSNNIDFNGSFQWGKDYMSMEPFSLAGLLCFYFMKYGEGGHLMGDGMFGLVVGASALSSMSFNIRIGDVINIRPYWSMLRLTRLSEGTEKGEFNINSALGTHLTLEFNRFMISPYAEWTFGWTKESPFNGYALGVSVGLKLYKE